MIEFFTTQTWQLTSLLLNQFNNQSLFKLLLFNTLPAFVKRLTGYAKVSTQGHYRFFPLK